MRIRTNSDIEKIKPSEHIQKFPIEKGLYLEVTPSGTKIFRAQLTRTNLKPYKSLVTFGRYPDIKIKEAIDKAHVEKIQFKNSTGIHIKAKSPTFKQVSGEWYQMMISAKVWGDVNATDVLGYLNEACEGRNGENYGFGDIELKKLEPRHVTRVAKVIISRGAHTVARDFLNNIRRVVEFYNSTVAQTERATITPDDIRAIKRNLPPAPKERHHHFLQSHEMPKFCAKLQSRSTASVKNRVATLILLLTAVRASNVRFMRVDELDFERNEWLIPAESSYGQRTKNGKEHVVPLSTQVVTLLKSLLSERALLSEDDPARNTPWVFYGDRQPLNPISDATIRGICVALGYKGICTPHGFRSTFATWAMEKSETENAPWSRDAVDAFIQHSRGDKVWKAYNRYQYEASRILIAQAWADQISIWTNEGNAALGY